MANPLRGEVQLGADGPVLVCDFNALCEIETHFVRAGSCLTKGLDLVDAGDALLTDLRVVVAALLRHHHPHITLREAGDVIDQHGDQMQPAIRAAFSLAMPESDPGKKP